MVQPASEYSLEEIQIGIKGDVDWLQSLVHKHPNWNWPLPTLAMATELQALAAMKPLELVGIRNFSLRFRHHVAEQHLKGMEEFLWRAEALERLALANP